MANLQDITKQYHDMIAEATREYEQRLARANEFFYHEMQKMYDNMTIQTEQLMTTLANLSMDDTGEQPKEE